MNIDRVYLRRLLGGLLFGLAMYIAILAVRLLMNSFHPSLRGQLNWASPHIEILGAFFAILAGTISFLLGHKIFSSKGRKNG